MLGIESNALAGKRVRRWFLLLSSQAAQSTKCKPLDTFLCQKKSDNWNNKIEKY